MVNRYIKYLYITLKLLIILAPEICLGQSQFDTLKNHKSEEKIKKFDDTRENKWSGDFKLVEIPSSVDGYAQRAYFYKTASKSSKPLIVSLHTWSGDYQQVDDLTPMILQKDLNYIHPDFRGSNNTVNACASELAISDIEDSISYAIQNSNVDTTEIYVIGVSGGGYATLASFMKLKHKVKKFAAWAPISDLIAWHRESTVRRNKYRKDILDCTNSGNELNVDLAKRKSPLFMKTPTTRLTSASLSIYAGVYDGFRGSVPITHSINFYNKILKDLSVSDSTKYVSDTEALKLLQHISPSVRLDSIGGRKVYLKREYGNLSLNIFEGNHEMLTEFALNKLLE
ncbi:alpha/beta hydrolase family protein [Zobellia alginiliquefaciens]|uniref:alpha/beta hydrolase family protein n=1 Tax=Zobellia alginiliquefaciens TaxID=3032586 RepID=UPI0023E3EB54|nr:prolyl oligopeptidase family serine peptidase [Zobellia alginiliquefaciens]